jgi:hypothetical protein
MQLICTEREWHREGKGGRRRWREIEENTLKTKNPTVSKSRNCYGGWQ